MALSLLAIMIVVLGLGVAVIVFISVFFGRAFGKHRGLGYPACGQCRYDLTGTIGQSCTCPECGADIRVVGVLPAGTKTRTKLPWIIIIPLALLILVAGAGSLVSFRMARQAQSEAQRAAAAAAAAQRAQPASPPSGATPTTEPRGGAD